MRSIFLFSSGMSSQTRKMTAPSLRATAIAYLAFISQSSSDPPVAIRLSLTALGSIVAHNLSSSYPSLNLASLNPLTGSVSLTQASRSCSVFDPINCKAWSLTSYQTMARINFLFPPDISVAPIPTYYTFSFAAASNATWQLLLRLKTFLGSITTLGHSTTVSSILWITLHKTRPSLTS